MKFYKSSVGRYFMLFAIIPAFVICIAITVFSTNLVYKVKVKDTKDMLRGAAKELVYSYELLGLDKMVLREENGLVYADDVQVTDDYTIVDRIKSFTGADISLFYMDTRIVTTLVNDDGSRYTNTKAAYVWNDYVQYGNDYFDEKIVINGTEYFGYYIPFHSDNDMIIGMGFAGVPRSDIQTALKKLNRISVMVCVLLCCIAVLLCIIVTKRLLKIQNGIMNYLSEIDEGDFNHVMPHWVYKRHDEYGMMARHFVKLNNSLRELIERDSLTGLYNRRAAMRFLERYVADAGMPGGESFSLAIGDIDYFKKVNDTYGHNCGDLVLRKISELMMCIPDEDGFAARWGGEEFILVFKGEFGDAREKLNSIMDKIRNTTVEYDGHNVNITMTFGICEYKNEMSLDLLISQADILMYDGKEKGRNIVVS